MSGRKRTTWERVSNAKVKSLFNHLKHIATDLDWTFWEVGEIVLVNTSVHRIQRIVDVFCKHNEEMLAAYHNHLKEDSTWIAFFAPECWPGLCNVGKTPKSQTTNIQNYSGQTP